MTTKYSLYAWHGWDDNVSGTAPFNMFAIAGSAEEAIDLIVQEMRNTQSGTVDFPGMFIAFTKNNQPDVYPLDTPMADWHWYS